MKTFLQTARFSGGPLDGRVAKIAFPVSFHVGTRCLISDCTYLVQDGPMARIVAAEKKELEFGAIILKWEEIPLFEEVLEKDSVMLAVERALEDAPVKPAELEPKATRMNYGQIAKLMNWIATRPAGSFASLAEAEKAAEDGVGFRVTGYSIQKAWDESGRDGSLLAADPIDNSELARRLSILEGAVARLELLVKPS